MADKRSPGDARSAAAAARERDRRDERDSREAWEDEGGSVDRALPLDNRHPDRVVSGRIVQAGGSGRRYKVVLTHEDGHKSERPCRTMREGEALIRSLIPTPPTRDTSRDRGPGQS